MPTFPQIPLPGQSAAPKDDQRKGGRFAISPTFPLRAVLALESRGRVSTLPANGPRGRVGARPTTIARKEWKATVVDLSARGVRIELNLAAVAFPEDPGWLKLSLGTYQLEIPCTVAHFRCHARYSLCGLQLNFPDAATEKTYRQLLEPVILGSSLAPVASRPDPAGRHLEQYAGKNSSLLTIWRPGPGGEVCAFDFRLNRCGVRWRAGASELSTYGVDESKVRGSAARPALKLKLKRAEPRDEIAPTVPLGEAQDEEVRWLFCLAVSNLSFAVAADVRQFLQSLVVA